MSRYQIAFAMLMFLGSPAWIGLLCSARSRSRVEAPGEFHPARCRHGAVRHHADHVVRAEDRDRDRRGLAARAAPFIRRRRPLHRQHRHRDDLLPDALADHVVRPHRVPHRPRARPPARLGRAGARRSCGAVERCGAAALAAYAARLELHPVLAFTVPAAIPYALFIAGGPRCRSRSPSSRRGRASAAR